MLVGKILISEMGAAGPGAGMTAAKAVRWPDGVRGNRLPLAAIAAAILLHMAAFTLTLMFVRDGTPPPPPDEQAVTLVFAPPAAAPAPAEPAAEPPVEAAAPPPEPPPPPAPAEPALEPLPPPPIPQAEATPAEPPKPVAPPQPVRRPMARVKPEAPAARVAEPPARPAGEPSTASRPSQPAAEAPIPADWQRSLAAWIAAHKVYPELARRRGVEGSVALRFTADRSGRVSSVALVSSAGSPVLDAAAEKLVGDAILPPFPAGMPQQTATLTVTIRYALAN
jgi:protein TonB